MTKPSCLECLMMTSHPTREILGLYCCGLLLAACGATPSAESVPNNQRQLETSACKLISATPNPPTRTGSFEVISVQDSTLNALKKTDDKSLEEVVRDYVSAANAQNDAAMIRALNDGVKVCHGLGLRTAP